MKINLIPDTEIILTEKNDILGTLPYVSVLKEMIANNEGKLTIGLYGTWGSGKSSIIKTLIKQIKNDYSFYHAIYYDSWKYSNESFKRKLIIDLCNSFEVNQSTVYKDLYTSQEFKEELNVSNFNWLIKILIFIPLLLPIVMVFISFIEGSFTDVRASVAAIGILFTFSFKLIEEILKKEKVTYSNFPISSSEQFEKTFQEIIEKNSKTNKIILFIDNIDRCEPETAKSILKDIKDFLEHKGIIFIIPIDDEALRNHLDMSDSLFSEYQRKIFNASLLVRPYSNNELLNYAINLNKKFDLQLPIEVLDICTSIYSKNPRRIVEFLNKIQIEKKLVTIQEKNKNIVKGRLSNNIPGLAKLLIIKEEWGELYNKIKEDSGFMDTLNKKVRDEKFFHSFTYPSENGLSIDKNKYDFLKRTLNISIEGYESFFLNKAMYDKKDEGIKSFILKRDVKSIMKYLDLERFTYNDVFKIFDELIKNEVYENRNSVIEFNVIGFLFDLYQINNRIFQFHKLISSKKLHHTQKLIGDKVKISKAMSQIRNEDIKTVVYNLSKIRQDSFTSEFIKNILLSVSDAKIEEKDIEKNKSLKNMFLLNYSTMPKKEYLNNFLFTKIPNKERANLENLESSLFDYVLYFNEDEFLYDLLQEQDYYYNLDISSLIEIANKKFTNIKEVLSLLKTFEFSFKYFPKKKIIEFTPLIISLFHLLTDFKISKENSDHDEDHLAINNIVKNIEKTLNSNPELLLDQSNLIREFGESVSALNETSFCGTFNEIANPIIRKYVS